MQALVARGPAVGVAQHVTAARAVLVAVKIVTVDVPVGNAVVVAWKQKAGSQGVGQAWAIVRVQLPCFSTFLPSKQRIWYLASCCQNECGRQQVDVGVVSSVYARTAGASCHHRCRHMSQPTHRCWVAASKLSRRYPATR